MTRTKLLLPHILVLSLSYYSNGQNQIDGTLKFDYTPKQIFRANHTGTIEVLPDAKSIYIPKKSNTKKPIAQIRSLEFLSKQNKLIGDINLIDKMFDNYNLRTIHSQKRPNLLSKKLLWETPKMERYVKQYLFRQSNEEILSNLKIINNHEGLIISDEVLASKEAIQILADLKGLNTDKKLSKEILQAYIDYGLDKILTQGGNNQPITIDYYSNFRVSKILPNNVSLIEDGKALLQLRSFRSGGDPSKEIKKFHDYWNERSAKKYARSYRDRVFIDVLKYGELLIEQEFSTEEVLDDMTKDLIRAFEKSLEVKEYYDALAEYLDNLSSENFQKVPFEKVESNYETIYRAISIIKSNQTESSEKYFEAIGIKKIIPFLSESYVSGINGSRASVYISPSSTFYLAHGKSICFPFACAGTYKSLDLNTVKEVIHDLQSMDQLYASYISRYVEKVTDLNFVEYDQIVKELLYQRSLGEDALFLDYTKLLESKIELYMNQSRSYDDGKLHSSQSIWIDSLMVQKKQYVQKGDPLFSGRIIDPKSAEVRLKLNQKQIRSITQCDTLLITPRLDAENIQLSAAEIPQELMKKLAIEISGKLRLVMKIQDILPDTDSKFDIIGICFYDNSKSVLNTDAFSKKELKSLERANILRKESLNTPIFFDLIDYDVEVSF
ncbi:HlyD family secretion protein [Ekhidna sp.]